MTNTPHDGAHQLKEGAIGWVLLAGLGVSYVIAGDYTAWNFGLHYGAHQHGSGEYVGSGQAAGQPRGGI